MNAVMEAYDDYIPSISTFDSTGSYKKGDFNTEDKERLGQPKKFEDEEVEARSRPEQKELGESLNVDQSTISRRLKVIEMIQKQKENWVPYELEAEGHQKAQNDLWIVVSKTQKKMFFASYRDGW